MEISDALETIYYICKDLITDIDEQPECFHEWFDEQIVWDCKRIMDICNDFILIEPKNKWPHKKE